MDDYKDAFGELLALTGDGVVKSLVLSTRSSREAIMHGDECWCIECGQTFNARQLNCRLDGSAAIVCPACGNDSLVPGDVAPCSGLLREALARYHRIKWREDANWLRSPHLQAMVVFFPRGERGCAKRYAQIVFKGRLSPGVNRFYVPCGSGKDRMPFVVSTEPDRYIPVCYGFDSMSLYPVSCKQDYLNVAADDFDDCGASWGLVLSLGNIDSGKHLSFVDCVGDGDNQRFEVIHVFGEYHKRIFDMAGVTLEEVLALDDDEANEFIIEHVLPWFERDNGVLEWEAEDVISMIKCWRPGQREGAFEADW